MNDDLNFVGLHGEKLVDNGYSIVPIMPGTKKPGRFFPSNATWVDFAGWRNLSKQPLTSAHLETWSQWPGAGVGVACGKVVAVDIDILDPDVAHVVGKVFLDRLGDTPCIRVGRRPKMLLVYRTETPFAKITEAPIEVLGEGQQFVAYAVHPDTGQPYQWLDGDLVDNDIERLPLVTEEQVRAAVAVAIELVPASMRAGRLRTADSAPGTVHASGVLEGDPVAVEQAVKAIPNPDLSWDDWNKVGMAIYAASGGLGFTAFNAFSQRSPKYDVKETTKRWTSYGRSPPNRIGMGTLVELAKQHGWEPDASLSFSKQPERVADTSVFLNKHKGSIVLAEDCAVTSIAPYHTPGSLTDKVPEFPDELTRGPGTLFALVDWITETARYPSRTLALGAALTLLAVMSGRRILGPTNSPTHLYTTMIAPTGAGKDAPLKAVTEILHELKLDYLIGPSDFLSGSAVSSLLQRQPVNVCCIDEFGDMLRKIADPRSVSVTGDISRHLRKLWGTGDETWYSQGWANKDTFKIKFPSLTILGATTPGQFFDALTGKDTAGGFLNRFLVLSINTKPQRAKPTATVKELPAQLRECLFDLSVPANGGNLTSALQRSPLFAPAVVKLKWGNGAETEWDSFSDGSFSDAEQDMRNRTSEMGLRLAAIRAFGRAGESALVEIDDVKWGQFVCKWSADFLVDAAVHRISNNPTHARYKKIRHIIQQSGTINRRVLTRRIDGNITRKELDDVLSMLSETGEVETKATIQKRGGHKIIEYIWRGMTTAEAA